MISPDKFGIGKGPEVPVPPPVEGQPPAPEVPVGAEPPQPSKEEREAEEVPEMVIEAPPQEGESVQEKPVKAVSTPARPLNIGERDLTGDIDIGRAAKLQDEINT